MKNPFLRLIVNLIALGFTCLVLVLLVGGVVLYHYSLDLPDYGELAHYDPDTVTRLYAADGKLLAEYAVEKRIYVPLKAVPKRVIQAFISAEDKDFYTNTGIDFRGILRAGLNNWRNLRSSGHSIAGGSTITQQVVKNFLLTPEKSISRKVKEAILAYRITKIYSKDRILELYLNEIYLGKGSYGVAAAAINYFNKSLDELTIEEAAMLAALPKEPAHIDPAVHYNIAKDRRDYVINRMMDDKYISAAEARAAIATPVTLRLRDKTETTSADFFAEEVRRELAAKFGDDTLYKGGLFVKTTLDPVMQQYSDQALRFALTEYDHRKGYRGPLTHIDAGGDWKKALAVLEDKKRWPLFDGERLAMVLESGKSAIGFGDGNRGALNKATMSWAQHKGLNAGDVIIAVLAEKEKDQFALHQIPEVNGAMIVMDPYTGKVLAMSGGYAYGGTEFNRATQAHRQPGSAFKPFVYLTAMENGFTPSTIVVDAPVELSQGSGMPVWRPGNYSEEYLGPATLREGLEKSRNAMTVRLATMLGVDKIIELAERFGIYDKLPRQFSLVLGAQETTLIRLANAYCIIDNGGKKVSPWLIERIDDKYGKTIFRRDGRACTGCRVATAMSPTPPLPADDRTQIVDARDNYQILSMLEGVVLRGTGARARILGRPLAGKTGTTNDSRDTWFMGFSPDLVAGIYVGYDQPRTLGRKETGATVALPGFIKFMGNALEGKPSKPFRIPPGINFIRVDAKTGQFPIPGNPDPIILEAFKEGQGPDTPPAAAADANGLATWQGATPQYNFPAENPDSGNSAVMTPSQEGAQPYYEPEGAPHYQVPPNGASSNTDEDEPHYQVPPNGTPIPSSRPAPNNEGTGGLY